MYNGEKDEDKSWKYFLIFCTKLKRKIQITSPG